MSLFAPRTHAVASLRMKQISLDNQSHTIRRLRAKLANERRESTAIKEGLENKAIVEEKASIFQTIQGLQEDKGAPAPFDDEWEEEPEEDPEEEALEDISVGEGEIVNE
ncbi:hypothetical protein F511_26551 [Dorcoceras hygrometricum]|uniref:Uncharacterized protein n=1 Tax=Dorcoceras hygrometricum TaxID=472368 RepID=A0A2Z7BXI4_9LAMI|nr:hypothetical protein F511_26551 [Dorcoceras hygrometricum]